MKKILCVLRDFSRKSVLTEFLAFLCSATSDRRHEYLTSSGKGSKHQVALHRIRFANTECSVDKIKC